MTERISRTSGGKRHHAYDLPITTAEPTGQNRRDLRGTATLPIALRHEFDQSHVPVVAVLP